MKPLECADTMRQEDATVLHHFPHVLRLQEVQDALVALPVTVGYYNPMAESTEPWVWLETIVPGRPRKVRVLKVYGTKTVNELEELARALVHGEPSENALRCPRCQDKKQRNSAPPGVTYCTYCYTDRRTLVEMIWCGDTAPIQRVA